MIKKLLLFGVTLLFCASCTAPVSTPDSTPGAGLGLTPVHATTLESTPSTATPQIPVTSGSTSVPQITPTDLPQDCVQTAVSPYDLNRCAESNAHRADLKMGQLVEAVQNTLSGEQLDEFKTLQARWESIADRLCGWEVGNYQDASVAQRVFSTCMQQQYRDRVQGLKLLLCPDRGLSGPCPDSGSW